MIEIKYIKIMNKQQKLILDLLQSKPGYIKKSALEISNRFKLNLKNTIIALKAAKIANKQSNTQKVQKPLNRAKNVVKMDKSMDRVFRSFDIPKIKRLFWDIETSYNVVSSWRVGYKIDISHDNIIKERAIICICYKWEGEDEVHYLRWKKGDDKQLLNDFVDILYQADESIGHNSDRFDLKWLRTRCAFHGIPMVPDYKTIDTLKLAKLGFNFNSNRLDYLGKFFGFGGKTETGGFRLWQEIVENNNEEAMKMMIQYCKDDVILLEKVYNKIEGYSKSKTHIGVLEGKDKCSCPKCGNEKPQKAGTRIMSTGNIQQRLKCNKCGTHYSISKITYDKLNNENK